MSCYYLYLVLFDVLWLRDENLTDTVYLNACVMCGCMYPETAVEIRTHRTPSYSM